MMRVSLQRRHFFQNVWSIATSLNHHIVSVAHGLNPCIAVSLAPLMTLCKIADAFADHNGDTNIDNDMISDHAHPSETMEQMTGTRTRRRRPIYEGDGEAPFQCNPAYEEHCGY
mmetsp:Transcript_12756/g.32692  ORF Transcript_12756/g.32692 Transcript_12756/m.32692 type:complete len:114 (+) Transcript_12756:2278-2619(+)